jgi:hypothetical protein
LTYVGGVLQIVPQVLSSDSSSFPFATGPSTTQQALSPATQKAMDAQSQLLAQKNKSVDTTFNFNVQPQSTDWDKLAVVNGGMRLPDFAAN